MRVDQHAAGRDPRGLQRQHVIAGGGGRRGLRRDALDHLGVPGAPGVGGRVDQRRAGDAGPGRGRDREGQLGTGQRAGRGADAAARFGALRGEEAEQRRQHPLATRFLNREEERPHHRLSLSLSRGCNAFWSPDATAYGEITFPRSPRIISGRRKHSISVLKKEVQGKREYSGKVHGRRLLALRGEINTAGHWQEVKNARLARLGEPPGALAAGRAVAPHQAGGDAAEAAGLGDGGPRGEPVGAVRAVGAAPRPRLAVPRQRLRLRAALPAGARPAGPEPGGSLNHQRQI